ncbi:hypothetical protein [Roseicella sp. DB1501]|uniref:hypothetical protein n=1 Tax=Roseicella sp. DB1501 TaxID=2730925 RepID=UPI001492EC6D|nr:hypothetical protein [Roseicella sp. DB1501]NOG73445.1 hypothetical protein [Roseicella sp. DB1501]
MESSLDPFGTPKNATDLAKAHLEELSKTLSVPIPLLITLTGLLIGNSKSIQIFGGNFPRTSAIMISTFFVFVMASHCCRLLTSLATITRIHQNSEMRSLFRFHPGIFNPFIMAWPKPQSLPAKILVLSTMWFSLVTGRTSAFFTLSFPMGFFSIIFAVTKFSSSSVSGFLLAGFWSLFYPMMLTQILRWVRVIDCQIHQDDIPLERWQAAIGIGLGISCGIFMGISIQG